ncbi:MAG: DNA polymerase III subunit delta [Bacteroidia bacterium]|nr:MAG: DNA polymerase III subunit delta [Bacteroidia bacterium]
MLFRDIAGRERIKKGLIRMVQSGRTSHALLFTGKEGCGNLAMAVAFAQYIFCHNRGEDDACGECPACRKVNRLIHPDFHFVYPVIKKKSTDNPVSEDFLEQWREFFLASSYHSYDRWLELLQVENKQASIFTRESENMLKKMNYKPYEAEYKIMVIWKADKMNVSTANKLLKIIEEPPERTIFLMVTESTDNMLATILSRTQIIRIPKMSKSDIVSELGKNYELSSSLTNEIAQIADGSYTEACKLAEQKNDDTDSDSYFAQFTELMRKAYTFQVADLLTWTEQMSKTGRERQKKFLSYSLRLIRENFIMNVSADNQEDMIFLNEKERAFAQNFSRFINKNNIFGVYSQLSEAYNHIERNGYSHLIFLDLSLKLASLLRMSSWYK